jgi:hypothetical protein
MNAVEENLHFLQISGNPSHSFLQKLLEQLLSLRFAVSFRLIPRVGLTYETSTKPTDYCNDHTSSKS